jgi:hypothetical protein
MRFIPGPKQTTPDALLVFQINAREESLLLATLRLYPVLENGHHRLSKEPRNPGSAEQRLLEESMAQLQAAHRRKVDELFRAPQRFFKDAAAERHLVLTGAQLEWLLQVLNDIRVGSWVRLGCPDLEKTPPVDLTRMNARALHTMDISGQFQMALLQAVK